MAQVISQLPEDFSVLSGDDGMTLPLMAIGGLGVISVVSNIVPDKIVAMVTHANNEEFDKARKIHYELLELFNTAFIETNPIPIKAAAAMMNLCEEEYRLPLCKMSDANREKLRGCLQRLNIIE